MWARSAEVMFGCWLMISPFIFRHPVDATAWWVNDLTCGTLVVLFGLFSFWAFPFWRPIRLAHLGNFGVGMWLVAFAFFTAGIPPAPALQNCVIIGLFLLMLSLVPNEAEAPPEAWCGFLAREQEQ